jgi:hypothetical protein
VGIELMIVDLANLLKMCFNLDVNVNVPKTIYSTAAYDKAKEAEHCLYNILKNIGTEEISKEDELSGKVYDHPVYRMADTKEDEEQRFDLSIGIPVRKKDGAQKDFKYYHFDLTTARDPRVLNDKKEKERRTGIKILQLPLRILRLADQGSKKDIDDVILTIRQNLDLE